ncbi:hypothetical protein OPT61_g2387 [Boeremia exigua]|uniref:Uncharacterized protein n=1 Tax=Boeremia exigua TaxID=749465 RepID=A0ACC2ILY8_9PLEO|nr:hypothetical protein OPT61_g2387 [Boeremia exigua]
MALEPTRLAPLTIAAPLAGIRRWVLEAAAERPAGEASMAQRSADVGVPRTGQGWQPMRGPSLWKKT